MQLKIAKQLNQLLMTMLGLIAAMGVGAWYFSGQYPELRMVFIGSIILVAAVFFVAFKWLENRWDKSVITKMAQNGKIALADIRTGKRIMPLRDSGFTNYWLYEFEADLYEPQAHRKIEKTFYEKMNYATAAVPAGSVYVTYDEEKPSQIFIIPNALISRLPALQPLVIQYERDGNLRVKYLDAHYNKGMVLRTFREAVAKEAAKMQRPPAEQESE